MLYKEFIAWQYQYLHTVECTPIFETSFTKIASLGGSNYYETMFVCAVD